MKHSTMERTPNNMQTGMFSAAIIVRKKLKRIKTSRVFIFFVVLS